MTNIKTIIEEIDTLKPVPPIAVQIMALAEDTNSSMNKIADLILHDPSITASLLKMCNSAYFGLSRKVESIRDAISLMGLDRIIELVLLTSASENFKNKQEGYGLGEGQLWRHAVTSAHVAKTLVERKGVAANKHLIFTAALLRDIGKVILGRFVAFSFEKINILVDSKGYSFNEAEKEIIGMSHEELGARIAEKWRFSEKMIYIIRNHHLMEAQSRKDPETATVYLADIICLMMGVGAGADGLAYRFYGNTLKQLGLSENDLQEVMVDMHETRKKIDELLNII